MDGAAAELKRVGVAGVSGRTCQQQRGEGDKPFHGHPLEAGENSGQILAFGLNAQRDVGHG
jgi:hypothetical protein